MRGRDLEQVQLGQEQLRREQGQQRQELQEEMLQLQEIAQLEAAQAVDKQAVANSVALILTQNPPVLSSPLSSPPWAWLGRRRWRATCTNLARVPSATSGARMRRVR